jgi:SAM-dependent methyltransferase
MVGLIRCVHEGSGNQPQMVKHSGEVRMGFADAMRREWDERARKDAFYYIASWRKDWNPSAFFASGEEDYKRLVAPVLERYGFSPTGKTIFELGCGTGRMTSIFAKHFRRVIACDISDEMIERAQNHLSQVTNVTWVRSDGLTVAGATDDSVDFVFSYLVLQHLPDGTLVESYIREAMEILHPGGLCLFQWNGTDRRNMNWRGRLAWELIDQIWGLGLERASRRVAKALGLDPQMAGKSWHGVAVPAARVAEAVRHSGGEILEMRDADTPMAWCCAKRPASAGAGPVS